MGRQKSQKNTKQYQNFKKNLDNKLQQFQKCRQWADINKWLHLLSEFLNGKKYSCLPHSVTLAKRLAQCLVPALPSGVHSAALKVYSLLLTNFQDTDNLRPLMSIGLFPFFQYSSTPLKTQLLKIYQTYFLNDSGSIQMTISLMNSLLTGLNQNNQELIKKIYLLVDKICKKYGYVWIDGAVWVNILKSNKVKIAGFKYFMKAFKDRDKEKINKIDNIGNNMVDSRVNINNNNSKNSSEQKKQQLEQQKQVKQISQQKQQQLSLSLSKQKQQLQPPSILQQQPQRPQRKLSFKQKPSYSPTFVTDLQQKKAFLTYQQLHFLQKLYQQTQMPDSPHNRFPNFSILVVNAIISCLQPQVQSLAKRAALEHLMTYLKLSQKQIVSENDALVLVNSMLKVLTLKEYPLTRRIYQYLFDQPNSDGVYMIDENEKKYQLKILIQSIRQMLNYNQSFQSYQSYNNSNKNNKSSVQQTLSIIQILINDHPILSKLILPQLSYQILKFIKFNCFTHHNNQIIKQLRKKVYQFNQNVILINKMIFLDAILGKVQKRNKINQNNNIEDENDELGGINNNKNIQNQIIQVIHILDFYIYTLYKAKYQNSNNKNVNSFKKSEEDNSNNDNSNDNDDSIIENNISNNNNRNNKNPNPTQQLIFTCLSTIDKILYFLKLTSLKYQRLSLQGLDFSNKIYKQTLSLIKNFQFDQQLIKKIDELIQKYPSQNIHARLLTLHPKPRKEILLPYINKGAFALVCIQNLLAKDSNNKKCIQLQKQQQVKLFYAIFKLLECHLWQNQSCQFIKLFIQLYQPTFIQQIVKVDPSEWLIYWRLFQGNVRGGVIRMIKSVRSQNPLKKNMSCKWIEANQHIISKIIDPIYDKLDICVTMYSRQESYRLEEEIQEVYEVLKIVFDTSKESFVRFFFIQKTKYLKPLLGLIFMNLQSGTQKLKTKSMDMMKFVLSQTETYQQKYQYINLTLPKLLSIFKQLISQKISRNLKQSSQNQSYMMQQYQQQQKHIFQSKQIHLNRVSSIQKQQNLSYLQQIEIIQYLANLNLSIRKSLKSSQFQSQNIIAIFEQYKLYSQVINGLIQSDLPYIRTLYLDFLRDSCDLMAKIPTNSKKLLNGLVNMILQKLFLILKTQDITSIQQTIQEKKDSNLKNSMIRVRKLSMDYKQEQVSKSNSLNNIILKDPTASFFEQPNINKKDINIQARYAQIIQMWNSVKFYTKFSISQEISNLPIVNLLSLILQSFPFSYLKYTQMRIYSQQNNNNQFNNNNEFNNINSQGKIDNYQILQQQIKNVTGLKKQVLQIIDIIWAKFNDQICQFLIQRGDPRIPIHCTIDPIKILSTINKNSKLLQILQYYKQTKISLPKSLLHFNSKLLTKQYQISYFLYLYLMYCNFSLIKSKKLGGFLQQLISILKVLKLSQHIQTKLWLMQLIYLLSQRVMMSKQIYIENGQKIRQQLQQITKDVIDDAVKAIVRERGFTYRSQVKTGFLNSLFNKDQKQQKTYTFQKNFPPTIFMMYENYVKRNKKHSFHSKSSKDRKQSFLNQSLQYPVQFIDQNKQVENFLFLQYKDLQEKIFKSYLSICCIKTLIMIGNSLIINIFQKDLTKVGPKIKQIILTFLPICENKSIQNQINIQLISQYIYRVLQNNSLKSEILPLIRKNLLEIYMGNVSYLLIQINLQDFFKCTRKSLYYWKQIVDACTEGIDLLSELLAREGLFEGLLKRRDQLNRQRIKSFERICFVIYSGRIDKYENKLRTVVEFLNQIMQKQDSRPAELILMFFCVRILLMRLSQSSLNKMFKTIWPGLIAILIQIFTKKEKYIKNVNLILAALKVIQLIHALDIQQFNFHKWIFITDFFGIKIQPVAMNFSFDQSQVFPPQQKPKKSSILTPFIFKPFMTNLLPEHIFKCQYIPQDISTIFSHGNNQNYHKSLSFKQKRKLIIKQASIQTIQQVQNLAFILMQYMIDCNQKRVEVERKEIEKLIEADFIQLDDYIFEVK